MPKFSFEIGLAIFGIAAMAALFLLDKSGKTNGWINVILLAVIMFCFVYPILNIPWLTLAPNTALRIWRTSLVIGIIILLVWRFGIYTWAAFTPIPATPPVSQSPAVSQTPIAGPSPGFTEKFDEFHVICGGNMVDIGNQNGNYVGILGINGEGRLAVSVSDNHLLIDADVFKRIGQPPLVMRRNEISGRPLGWDKQSTSNALEIVNEDLLPVFQIIYSTDGKVIINGVFISGDKAIILNNDSTWGWFRLEDIKGYPIKRLFKYPSWKYPGVLLED